MMVSTVKEGISAFEYRAALRDTLNQKAAENARGHVLNLEPTFVNIFYALMDAEVIKPKIVENQIAYDALLDTEVEKILEDTHGQFLHRVAKVAAEYKYDQDTVASLLTGIETKLKQLYVGEAREIARVRLESQILKDHRAQIMKVMVAFMIAAHESDEKLEVFFQRHPESPFQESWHEIAQAILGLSEVS